MDLRCVLCDTPTAVRAIGAFVATGNQDHPDGDILCRHCAALPASERQRLRDASMARMLAAATAERPRR
jgi:hypothetical protein